MRWKDLKQMVMSHEAHAKITLGMAITLLTFIILGVWYTAVFVNKTENDIANNAKDITDNVVLINENSQDIEKVSEEIDDIQIQYAEANIKLANIEAGIIELKAILKDKQ